MTRYAYNFSRSGSQRGARSVGAAVTKNTMVELMKSGELPPNPAWADTGLNEAFKIHDTNMFELMLVQNEVAALQKYLYSEMHSKIGFVKSVPGVVLALQEVAVFGEAVEYLSVAIREAEKCYRKLATSRFPRVEEIRQQQINASHNLSQTLADMYDMV